MNFALCEHARRRLRLALLPLMAAAVLVATISVEAARGPVVASASAPSAAPIRVPIGVLQPGGTLFASEQQAGLTQASIELTWSAAESGNGVWDENYFASIRGRIAAATGAGLSPVLALGIQYPPSWVFALDPGSRLKDQFGDVWQTSPANGDDVVNGVFSQPVRGAIAGYAQKAFAELGTSFAAVRWGGGLPYDEVRYPGCPAGRSNCYWAFDAAAQAGSPVPGYVPGTGDPSKAQAFLDYYLGALANYTSWGLATIRQSYAGEIDVLFPSWGVRPGDLTQAVDTNLAGASPRSSEITAGLDWSRQMGVDSSYGNVVAWTTWLNRLDDYTDVASWSPAHFLASIAPAGMGVGGENTYGSATASDLQATLANARAYAPRRVLWMNESLTQQPGNATLGQLGQAAGLALEGETLSVSPTTSGGPISDHSASQGSALEQWINGTARGQFSLVAGSSRLVLRMRANTCLGGPAMVAQVDGRTVLAMTVSSTGWTDFATGAALAPGAHTLTIRFSNDYASAQCDRNLYVDLITVM